MPLPILLMEETKGFQKTNSLVDAVRKIVCDCGCVIGLYVFYIYVRLYTPTFVSL